MKNPILDTYDVIILVDIQRDPNKTIRELAERVPIRKTQVGKRISELEEFGLVRTKGTTSGAKRELTEKGLQWLLKNGYLKT